MSTSQKHAAFIAEPLADKPVTECAGIGKVLGERLTENGYEKAYNLVGQYLLLNKDVETFEEWLKMEIKANKKQAGDCAKCIDEWSQAFIQ